MVKAEEIIFGYALVDNPSVVKLYMDNIHAASQISFVLGKILPQSVDLWIGPMPKNIPDNFIPLRVTMSEEPELQKDLPNRTKRWYPAARMVILAYHQRYTSQIDDVKVSISIAERDR